MHGHHLHYNIDFVSLNTSQEEYEECDLESGNVVDFFNADVSQ